MLCTMPIHSLKRIKRSHASHMVNKNRTHNFSSSDLYVRLNVWFGC